jgi:RNA polymerase sigma-70 factor (ECF subfamily)
MEIVVSPLLWQVLLLLLALQEDTALDDRELAARIKRGDAAAFRQFFDRHHQMLFQYLRRRQVVPEVCNDLIQQAFVYIWEKRDRIDPGKSLRALLFKIGYTRALNHFRDNKKFDAELPMNKPADEASPESHTDYAMMQATLARAVAELPERRRAVFELCFLQEMTYREAAEILGISIKTVEHQMGHALKTVRTALQMYL